MSRKAKTKIAMILVAVEHASDVRRTLCSLQKQKNVEQIELLLVGPDKSIFNDLLFDEIAGFGRVEKLSWGQPIDNVDLAAAVAIRAARSPLVTIVEDHVYLEPDWAEVIIRTFDQHPDVAGVGCVLELANAPGGLAWANHLFALSKYTVPLTDGPVPRVSRHHVVYRKDWLERHDSELETLLPRGGGIIELAAQDGGLYMAAGARLNHLSCSRWFDSLLLRIASGRLNGSKPGNRSGLIRRLSATLRTPQIAWWRVKSQLSKYPQLKLRAFSVAFATSLLTSAECIGYVLGIWAGKGNAEDRVCSHECQRELTVCKADIREIERNWPMPKRVPIKQDPLRPTRTEAA